MNAATARGFRAAVALRRLPEDPVTADVRRRYEERFGERPEDPGGWYHPDDWARIGFARAALRSGRTFLDVGLGAGQFVNAVALDGRFEEVHGSDPTRFTKYVEFHESIRRVDHGIEALPFDDDAFDVVTCMEVIEHLPEEIVAEGIAELRRVCRGQLLMSVPFEEPEPIYRGHRRRFEFADLRRVFPDAEMILLDRPGHAWALLEEWHGASPAPVSAMRLAAAEASAATASASGSAPSSLGRRGVRFARRAALAARRRLPARS